MPKKKKSGKRNTNKTATRKKTINKKTLPMEEAILLAEKKLQKNKIVKKIPILHKQNKKIKINVSVIKNKKIKTPILKAAQNNPPISNTVPNKSLNTSTKTTTPAILKKSKQTGIIILKNSTNYKSPHLIDLRNQTTKSSPEIPASTKEKYKFVYKKEKELSNNIKLPKLRRFHFAGILNKLSITNHFQAFTSFAGSIFSSVFQLPKKIIGSIADFFSFKNTLFSFKFSLPEKWSTKLTSFIVFGMLLVLPLQALLYYDDMQDKKGSVLNTGSEAVNYLSSAGRLALEDSKKSRANFQEAIDSFNEAEAELQNLNSLIINIAKIIPGEGGKIKSGENILMAGKNIASAGKLLIGGFSSITYNDSLHLTKKISLIEKHIQIALPFLKEADFYLQQVDEKDLPLEYRENFVLAKNKLPLLIKHTENFSQFTQILQNILGHEQNKRYLVFFQNNAELRPTGGFLGSFALMDLDRGKITNLEIPSGGTYDVNGGLKENILAPEPLHLVNARWQLQDANWFPDFPTSARKMMWFYEKSGGSTADGVITITPDIIEDILKITGSLDLQDQYGVKLDEKNFWITVQTEAEKKFNETKESKKIIAKAAPLLIKKILNSPKEQFLQILSIINNSLQEKQMLFYFNDPQTEKNILDLSWGGEIKQAPADYLAVIDTNISGGKTDRNITTTINHETELKNDGSIIDAITIKKTHNGQRNESFSGVKNMNYLRVYVPAGSTLLEAGGFLKPPGKLFEIPSPNAKEDTDLLAIEKEKIIDQKSGTVITKEFGKTVFGNWLEIEPESSTIVTLKYKLPFSWKNKEEGMDLINKLAANKSTNNYSLFIQKQPGTDNLISSTIKTPSNQQIIWQYPAKELWTDKNEQLILQTELNTDKFIGIITQEK